MATTWQDAWKKWTHVTYGIIQSIHVCQRLDGGNVSRLEIAVSTAQTWAKSALGFDSSAWRNCVRPNSIGIAEEDGPVLMSEVTSATAEILLIQTVAVTEVLLSELLLARGILESPPRHLRESLDSLRMALEGSGELPKHEWALDAMHELRLLRNVLVHAAGTWTDRSVDDFKSCLPAKQPPQAGTSVAVNVDDLFAYRRAARTILNAADRL